MLSEEHFIGNAIRTPERTETQAFIELMGRVGGDGCPAVWAACSELPVCGTWFCLCLIVTMPEVEAVGEDPNCLLHLHY